MPPVVFRGHSQIPEDRSDRSSRSLIDQGLSLPWNRTDAHGVASADCSDGSDSDWFVRVQCMDGKTLDKTAHSARRTGTIGARLTKCKHLPDERLLSRDGRLKRIDLR